VETGRGALAGMGELEWDWTKTGDGVTTGMFLAAKGGCTELVEGEG